MPRASPRTVRLDFACKNPAVAKATDEIIAANEEVLARLRAVRERSARNSDVLDYAEAAFRAYIYCARKLQVMGKATDEYRRARRALPDNREHAAALLSNAADDVRGLAPELETLIALYEQAEQALGASAGDVRMLNSQRDQLQAVANELTALADEVRGGGRDRLPPAEQFGFYSGVYAKVGSWAPEQMSEEGAELRVDITKYVTAAGELSVQWHYTRGAHGVHISRTELLVNGKRVAEDEHPGWSGAGSHDNTYTLTLEQFIPGAKYEILGWLESSGGTDSRGDIWLNTHASE